MAPVDENATVPEYHRDDDGDTMPRPILSPRELQGPRKLFLKHNSGAAPETTNQSLNILLSLDNHDGSVSVKENASESQLSRRSSTSNPLGDIASTTNKKLLGVGNNAFFGATPSSKRLLESSNHSNDDGGSVSWLSNTFSTESSKARTTIAGQEAASTKAESIENTNVKEEKIMPTSRPLLPRFHHTPCFESVVGGRNAVELLREAGTSFTDEGTSVVSSWLEDATATGIFRSLHVDSEELSSCIPTPPASCSNSNGTIAQEPVYAIPASSSSWSKEIEALNSPNNSSNRNETTSKAQNANNGKQFEPLYNVWRRKGLLSDEKLKNNPTRIETTTILTQDDVKAELFEPDPSVTSSRNSKQSCRLSSTGESTNASKIKSNQTLKSSSNSPGNSCFANPKQSKSRRETLAVVPRSGDQKNNSNHRKSLPATTHEKSGFADILKTWQTQSANKPCGHFLSPQQNPTAISCQQKISAAPVEEIYNPSNAADQSESSASKSLKLPMPVQNRQASSLAPPPPPPRCLSPLNDSGSPVAKPPKSQAWKMKRQSSERMISATSSAATKTAKNDISHATTGTTHWSFGRSSSRGHASLDRQSMEDGSGEIIDKYTHFACPSSEGSRRNAEIMHAKAIPKSISVNGSKPNDRNALQDLARATNRLAEYFDPPKIGSADSASTTTPSIPREVAIAMDSSKPDALLSPFTTRIVRNLEKTYNQADDVRTPADRNFADRPWRRDSLVARVERFQDNECKCVCSESMFSGNDVMIDFFLPLMGTACTCGHRQPGLVKPEEPTSLSNILRPWQVDFLASFGIYRGDELVKANHRSARVLAAALRKYRKRRGMTPFRTKSCGMALQIWSRTSKAFVRSIRSQLQATESAEGEGVKLVQARELRMPNALYIVSAFLDSMPSDVISHGPGSSSGCCDQTLISTITGSHSSGDGANWSTITPGATVDGEI